MDRSIAREQERGFQNDDETRRDERRDNFAPTAQEIMSRAPEIALAGKVEFIRDNLVHGIRKMPITFAAHG